MAQKKSIQDEPDKKRNLAQMYQAIERMDEADRKFIAGAIAFAQSATRTNDNTPTNRPG